MSDYSGLPDIDNASAVIYETPDPAPLAASSNISFDTDPAIDHRAFDKSQAQQVFETSVVDASDADFVERGHRPYSHLRVSTVPETLNARIARLKREVEEVSRLKETQQQAAEIDNLRNVLDSFSTKNDKTKNQFYSDLGSQSSEGDRSQMKPTLATTTSFTPGTDLYTSRLIEADQRIAQLERIIGTGKVESPLVLSLQECQQKLMLLTGSQKGLGAATSAIQQVTASLEQLRTVHQQLSQSMAYAKDIDLPPQLVEVRKVDQLYEKLPALESQASLVPLILSRIKSLQAIHADARDAIDAIRDIDNTVQTLKTGMSEWMETLKSIETKIQDHINLSKKNQEQVEAWVKNVESRIANLE
uniref:ARAD1C39512p n=1 Tax=Blastobotrys adeninivorans TaxID=409370 RepID=A0A060T3T4_BLAAD